MAEACSIRRLGRDDLPAYKALRDAMLAAHPEAFTSDAAAEAARGAASYLARLGLDRPEGGQFTLGAWRGDVLVGVLSCERDGRAKVRHIGHLVGMMVRPEVRRGGIGRALLEAGLVEARRAQGLELLTLSVTAGNAAAERLYETAGFVSYGLLKNAIRLDGRYHDKRLMTLTL